MSAHTPGPWHPWKGNYRHIYADENNSELVSIVSARSTFDEMRANAYLVAASPDLLQAAKDFVQNVKHDKVAGYGDCEVQFDASFKQLEAAIAKAESRE